MSAMPEPLLVPDTGTACTPTIWAAPNDKFVWEINDEYRLLSKWGATVLLKNRGLCAMSSKGGASEIEEILARAIEQRPVVYAGPLCGREAGPMDVRYGDVTRKLLITEGFQRIEPVPGEWPTIRRDIEQVLTGEDGQLEAFYAALAGAVKNLHLGTFKPVPAVLMMGDASAGKSAIQALITMVLGGREASAGSWLKGNSFNAELFRAEHLKVEDDPPKDNRARGLYTDRLRQIVACDKVQCHEKGATPVDLPVRWFLTISCNMSDDDLQAIPQLTHGIEDKVCLFKCQRAAWVDLYADEGGRERHQEEWRREIPAFLHWLIHEFEVPGELVDARFRVKAWQSGEVKELARGLTPEQELLGAMRVWRESVAGSGADRDKQETTMTADQWVTTLKEHPLTRSIVPAKYARTVSFGRGMAELARMYPDVVSVRPKPHCGSRRYTFHHGTWEGRPGVE